MSRILLTGGFGYIGSHTAAILAEQKKDFLIYDNFINCKSDILERLEKENMDLEASTNDYKRLLHLNDHVDNLFKKKLEKIRSIGKKN